MTKLLMVTGDRALAAGKEGAFHNTLAELHKHFDRIDVICPCVSVKRFDMTVFGNVHIHPSPWPLALQPLWIRQEGRRIFNDHHPELMTVHDYPPFYNGIGARLLHASTSLPYVTEIMHVPGYPRAAGLRERFYRWLMRQFVAWDVGPAKAVRIINHHEVPEFLTASGVPKEKLVYAPAFYIDMKTFRPYDTEKKYDLAFVARMADNKGIGLFLDVVERTGLVGVAIGDGPLLSWVRLLAKRRGLKLHIPGFVGRSEDVARYLNESRLLLMTSLNEGGPRVVLEALACGVPVVATPVGIVPDVLPPEAIEDWDTAALADKIKNVLSDPVLYGRLQQAGLQTIQRFERSSAIAAYADILKELSDGRT
jgi:glycosyltransferase involved in cell wall biosynthesis